MTDFGMLCGFEVSSAQVSPVQRGVDDRRAAAEMDAVLEAWPVVSAALHRGGTHTPPGGNGLFVECCRFTDCLLSPAEKAVAQPQLWHTNHCCLNRTHVNRKTSAMQLAK